MEGIQDSIKDILKRQDVKVIDDLIKVHGIEKSDGFQGLIDSIVNEKFILKVIDNLSLNLVYFLWDIKSIGVIQSEQNSIDNTLGLRRLGIVFQENDKIIMPKEIIDILDEVNIEEIKNRALEREKLRQYILAFSNLYGKYNLEVLMEFYNEKRGIPIDKEFVIDYINKIGKDKVKYFKGEIMKITSEEVEINESLNQYYEIEEDKLYNYINDNFYDYTLAHKKLDKFLNKIVKNFDLKNSIINEISIDLKRKDLNMNGIIQILDKNNIQFDSLKDLDEFTGIVQGVNDNTRKWCNKGFTNNELKFNEKAKLKKEVGRNSPCICGSGKKYKKCCGKTK